MPKSIKEILTEARALIADPERGTQGAYAVDVNGNEIYPGEPSACAFCGVGSLMRVSHLEHDENGDSYVTARFPLAYGLLNRAAMDIFEIEAVLVNDGRKKDQAHANILQVFDRAIEMAEA